MKNKNQLELEDSKLALKNMRDGISEYIDTQNKKLGKIYVTPKGPFNILKRVEEVFGMYRKTIIQRFKSKRANLAEWYVIQGDTPLQPEEECSFCDEVDDVLFSKDCWMTKARHKHNTPMDDDVIIEYMFQGTEYQITRKLLLLNEFPHFNQKEED